MKAIKFNYNKHACELITMLRSQDAYITPKSEIPAHGYLAFYKGVAVAACFLRRVEGGFGQIDGLVALRYAEHDLKQQAIDLVIYKCVEKAKALHITNLLAFCKTESPILKALSTGFVKLPHTTLALTVR